MDSPEITNFKHQNSNKFQIPISNDLNHLANQDSIPSLVLSFEILNLGHCDLFEICVLLSGISKNLLNKQQQDYLSSQFS